MQYKQFASIKEQLSAVGLGCWGFSGGTSWTNGDDQQSIATVHKAIDLGINFFDVAPIYGRGHAEEVLGKAIQSKRQNVFLASKCGMRWDEQDNVTLDLTRKSIFEEIDISLKRLNTDYIDLYQMHWPDPETPIEESLEALLELRKQGKIRYIGLTNFSLKDMETAQSLNALDCAQGLYNLLEHNPSNYHNIPLAYRSRSEVLPFCKTHGIPYLPYSPLMQGLLTGHFDPSEWAEDDVRQPNPKFHGELWLEYKALAETIADFAKTIDKPISQVAINWLIAQQEIGPIICGAQEPQHIEQNATAANWQLTDEQFTQLDKSVNEKLSSLEKG